MMDLTWCRFGRHGWYENGGRFLQILPGVSSNSDDVRSDDMEEGFESEPILDSASLALFSVRAGA
jgi:hypothetical protein